MTVAKGRPTNDPDIGPPAFHLVDLRSERTWSLAPLEDWIRERQRIESKLGPTDKRTARTRLIGDLLVEADREFCHNENRLGRRTADVLSPDQERRLGKLQRKKLKEHALLDSLLTRWELEFHRQSSWLEHIGRNSEWPHEANKLCATLMERVLIAESGLSIQNHEEYDRRFRQLKAYGVKRNPKNEHPFLPRPLELLQVCRLTRLLVRWLAHGFDSYQALGLSVDKYGAAFPCPQCQIKHLNWSNAIRCCNSSRRAERPEYSDVIVLGGAAHKHALIEFLRALKLQRYVVARSLDELLNWNGWRLVRSSKPAGSTYSFLAFLFQANPETVVTNLSRNRLNKQYDRHMFAKEGRLYLPDIRDHYYAVLPPPRWYSLSPEGDSPTMGYGHTYSDLWPGGGGS